MTQATTGNQHNTTQKKGERMQKVADQDVIETRMDDTTYNGWTNYETWNVALWIDNDERMHTYWHGMAEHVMREQPNESKAVRAIAENLKDAYTARFGIAHGMNLTRSDIDRFACRAVDWREVAEGLIATVEDYHAHGDTFLSRKGGE